MTEEIHRLEKEHQNNLNGSGAGGDTAFLERIKILEAKLEHMEEPQRLLEEQRTEVDKLRDLLKQRTAELEQVKHITPNQNNKFKNKTKPGTSHQMKISNTSNHFDIDDDKSQDSFDDDNEKDPDWMKTPRFNKLQNSKVKYLMPALCCPLVEKISKFVHLCSLLFKESLGFFHMFKFRLKDFDSFQECSVSTCPRAIQLVLVFFLNTCQPPKLEDTFEQYSVGVIGRFPIMSRDMKLRPTSISHEEACWSGRGALASSDMTPPNISSEIPSPILIPVSIHRIWFSKCNSFCRSQ
uniref:Uncharacterized protein n=1 Tax=Timema shepardi TaxID=629360 RepID=A0A7R9FUL5_TIMSH|nr:unnamed protein product [Timema shepardi]